MMCTDYIVQFIVNMHALQYDMATKPQVVLRLEELRHSGFTVRLFLSVVSYCVWWYDVWL